MRHWFACALLIVLAGCEIAPPQSDRATTAQPAFPGEAYRQAAAAGEAVYDFDTGASRLWIFVYRAGALARLGHNHLLVARELRGAVAWPDDSPQDARLDVVVPVEELAVDPSEPRAELSSGFGGQPDQEAVDGTRNNLLSAAVLDASQYPVIGIRLVGWRGDLPRPILDLAITVRGRRVEVTVPAAVRVETDQLIAAGRFVLTHKALGITPFSAAGGALRVADPLVIEFELVGQRRDS